MPRSLPTGTVTFLFTDIEGSTRLLQVLGAERYAAALADHRAILRDAFARHDGVEVDTQGDAFFVAFRTAADALAAAADATDALASGPVRVRIGIHTGTPHLTDEGYVGVDVHRAARIAALAHGGQVLLSAAAAALVPGQSLRDLGEHRLKDLSGPERIFQAGGGDFPPLRSLHRTNLPIPATPLVGREREVAEVVSLLEGPHVRLLTLTGPGGTGKTRLSLHAAGALADRYSDGVWWVPLAPLRDAALVLPTAGRALGANDGLDEYIGDRCMLLVLDNFEQVVDAATDVADLLSACPNLRVLATSRERLGIAAEQEYQVPPLAPPEGRALFVARARAAGRDVAAEPAVDDICTRLDNLPLAIELAAARTRVMTPLQIRDRLERRLPLLTGGARDLPDRQRTLRGAIEWSHELLTRDEQRLFARLSVFRGGWALESAEDVAAADPDTLQSLADKSLVRLRDDRFGMLETIREYAMERLEASGEGDEVGARHAEHFLALAEEAEPHVRYDEDAWLARLDREHDNLRAALDWLEEHDRAAGMQRLAGALMRFWYVRSHLVEGRARLERAVAADASATLARAKALAGLSVMVFNAGEPAAARLLAAEALELFRELGDPWWAAYATMMVGNAYGDEEDYRRAIASEEDALRQFDALGDEHYATIARSNVASMLRQVGDLERARDLDELSLRSARQRGNRRAESSALMGLAACAHRAGRKEEAMTLLAEATRIAIEQGDTLWVANHLRGIASSLAELDRHEDAALVLGAADRVQEQMGVRMMPWAEREREETYATLRARLGEAVLDDLMRDGRELESSAALDLAVREGDAPA